MPHDSTGWPIFEGSIIRVNPRGGLAYTATVTKIDGTNVTARDRKDLERFVDHRRCYVQRITNAKRNEIATARRLSAKAEAEVPYKNPFPKDRGQ